MKRTLPYLLHLILATSSSSSFGNALSFHRVRLSRPSLLRAPPCFVRGNVGVETQDSNDDLISLHVQRRSTGDEDSSNPNDDVVWFHHEYFKSTTFKEQSIDILPYMDVSIFMQDNTQEIEQTENESAVTVC